MQIVEIIFPILAIAMMGYLVAFSQLISQQHIQGLSQFVFVIVLPVFLFNSMANMQLPTSIDWEFFLSYYVVGLSIFALGAVVQKQLFHGSQKEQAIFGLGSSFSNLILVGLPVISTGLGEQSLLPLFMIVSVHSAILFTLTTVQLQRSNHSEVNSGWLIVQQTIKNIVRNPVIISLASGLVVNLLDIPIPKPLGDSLSLLSQATLPCALFVLGASLNSYKVSGHLAEAGTMIGLKMILQPLMVWVLAFLVFRIDEMWGNVAVLASGMPVGITTFIFAEGYQTGTATLSTAILLSTILAIFSQTLLLSLLT